MAFEELTIKTIKKICLLDKRHMEHSKLIGTPHHGTDVAVFGTVVSQIVDVCTLRASTNPKVVSELKRNSEILWEISKSFVDRSKNLKIITFYETQKMRNWTKLVCCSHPRVGQSDVTAKKARPSGKKYILTPQDRWLVRIRQF